MSPPTLVTVTLGPDTVYLDADTAVVASLIEGRSPSGLDSVVVSIVGPDGSTTLSCRSNAPSAGTRNDGFWFCPLLLPPASDTGTWSAATVGLYSTNVAGNSRVWTAAELATSGLDAAVYVTRDAVPLVDGHRWINPAGGSFSVGANWDRGTAPTASDTAVIDLPGAYVVSVADTVEVSRIEIGGPGAEPTLRVAGGRLTLADSALVGANARLELADGLLTGSGALHVEGRLAWGAGTVSGSGIIVITPTGLLELVGDDGIAIISVPVVNDGTVTVPAGRTLRNAPEGHLRGDGSWDVASTGALELRSASLDNATVDLGPGSAIRGAGTLRVIAGRIALRGDIDLDGRLAWNGSPIVELHTSGTARSAKLDIDGGQLRLLGTSPLSVEDSLLWRSAEVNGSGTLHIADGAYADLGPVTGTESRHLRGGATLRLDGHASYSEGALTVSDSARFEVTASGRFELSNGRSIGSQATGGPLASRFVNYGTFVKLPDGSTSTLVVPFVNHGRLDLGDAGLAVNVLTSAASGVLLGSGVIDAPVTGVGVEGTIAPGRIAAAANTDTLPGRITVDGNLVFSGTAAALEFDVGGTAADSSDALAVSGALTAAGTLRIRGINGYVPALGDTIALISFGARSGNVAQVTGLEFGVGAGGVALDTLWTNDALLLVARAPDSTGASRTLRWINPAGGNFGDGANWDTGVPPASGDTVLLDLDGSYTVTVSSTADLSVLVVGSGSNAPTLQFAGGTLTVRDSTHLAVGAFLTGLGIMRSPSGVVRLDGGVNLTGRWESEAAQFEIGPGATKNIHVLELTRGTLRVLDNSFLTVRDTLYWQHATLAGSASGTPNGTLRIANDGLALLTTDHPRALRDGLRLEMDGRLHFGAGTLHLDAAVLEVGATGWFEALNARAITGEFGSDNLLRLDGRLLGPVGDTLQVNVPVLNRGRVYVRGGGAITAGAAFEHNYVGRIIGDGTFEAALPGPTTLFRGAYVPGARHPEAPGDTLLAQLTIAHNGSPIVLEPGSLVDIALGGSAVDQIARLHFSDPVTLNGTLWIRGTDGFLPQVGDSFPVLTFSGRSGTFPFIEGLDYAIQSGGALLDTLWTAETLFLVGVEPGEIPGEFNTWTGSVSDDFHNPANWSRGRVPGPLDSAFVQMLSNPIRAYAPVRVHWLELQAGVSATFDDTLAVRHELVGTRSANFTCGGPLVVGDTGITTFTFTTASGLDLDLSACNVVLQHSYAQFPPTPLARLELRGDAVLDLRSHVLAVLGDLVISDSALLRMDDLDGLLVVGGDAYFGGANSFGQLTDGELQIGGNLVQTAGTSTRSFAPSGAHRTELLGSTNASVSFASPGVGESGFNRLAIIKSGGAALDFTASDVRAAEVYVFESDVTIGAGRTFTVGNFTEDGSARFTVQAGGSIVITGTCSNGTIQWTGAGSVSPLACFVVAP